VVRVRNDGTTGYAIKRGTAELVNAASKAIWRIVITRDDTSEYTFSRGTEVLL